MNENELILLIIFLALAEFFFVKIAGKVIDRIAKKLFND